MEEQVSTMSFQCIECVAMYVGPAVIQAQQCRVSSLLIHSYLLITILMDYIVYLKGFLFYLLTK